MTMETNKNIEQLLEMLDHPESYSEQEIMDIINRDDETREAYRQLVRAQSASRYARSADQPVDVDEAWQQFEQRHYTPARSHSPWLKMVATLVGIMLMSGIAWAAVYTVRQAKADKTETKPKTEKVTTQPTEGVNAETVTDTIATAAIEPIVFDNVPLDEMLAEIAAYYDVTVEFQNEEARQLRFHFVWNKRDGLEKVLEDMSYFESVDIKQVDNRLIVQ